MRKGTHRPDKIVDIKDIAELKRISWEDGGLFIGAAVTWTQIKEDPEIEKHFPALTQAAKVFGCKEIRNRATIGGNICNASPGSEAGGPCVVYCAKAKLWKNGEERTIPIADFILAPGHTAIEQGEILTGILFPMLPKGSRSGYRRTARTKGQDLATCAVTVAAINPKTPDNREIRVGLSAVTKTPSRFPELEDILSYKPITNEVLNEAKNWMEENLNPRASSLRGTPDYKKDVLGGMLQILLKDLKL
jgi:CO/xanthine dehydrogenase FAD-binding subunit